MIVCVPCGKPMKVVKTGSLVHFGIEMVMSADTHQCTRCGAMVAHTAAKGYEKTIEEVGQYDVVMREDHAE